MPVFAGIGDLYPTHQLLIAACPVCGILAPVVLLTLHFTLHFVRTRRPTRRP